MILLASSPSISTLAIWKLVTLARMKKRKIQNTTILIRTITSSDSISTLRQSITLLTFALEILLIMSTICSNLQGKEKLTT